MSIDRGHGIATSAVLADSYDLDALIADTQAVKVAAELAETNAETSETNAATSATNAATSATNAATSATNAATSETNIAGAETNCAASAAAALVSENNAQSSEDDATTAQIASATSATLAEDWASKTTGTVDGTNYSSKYYATNGDVATVATNIANVNTVAGNSANVTTVAGSIADVNRYADEYKIAATAPTSPTEGDLWYDSTANELKYYDGTAWNKTHTTSATDLTSGTLPDGRFPATLPAISGANLTDIPSSIDGLSDARKSGTNLGLGTLAVDGTTSGTHNVGVGQSVLTATTTGGWNTGLGNLALLNNISGSYNTAVGYKGLWFNTANFNTAVGSYTLALNTTGEDNTASGYSSLYSCTTGTSNTGLGVESLFGTTTGSKNIGIGYRAGDAIITGSNNTIIGDYPGTAALADTVVIAAGTTERIKVDAGGLSINGTAFSTGGLGNIVEDSTPQLGGNLDTQTFTVDGRDVSVDGAKLDTIATSANNYTHPTGAGNEHLPSTVSQTEAGYLDGVTSAIQTQLDGKSATAHNHTGTYEPADATILKDADIGVNVQAYDANLVSDATYVATDENFTTADHSKLDGIEASANNYTHPVTAGNLHVPTGGTVGQVLTNTASGTGTWQDSAGGGGEEGTAILSTGETGGTKYLREDGDGTCSWQAVAGGGGASDIDGLTDGYNDSSSVGLGTNALLNDDGTANSNTAVGTDALKANTSGNLNTATGLLALTSNTVGLRNTATGYAALADNINGSRNTATGFSALSNNTSASYNSAFGRYSLFTNTTGSSNTAVGAGSLQSNTTGTNNTATGYNASLNNTTGTYNTALGSDALQGNSVSNLTGSYNTGIGYQTGYNLTTGYDNVMLGKSAGGSVNTGHNNVFTGNMAGYGVTTGVHNIASGNETLRNGTTCNRNVAIGTEALRGNATSKLTGAYNTGIGYQTGYSLSTGQYNVLNGYQAGYALTTSTASVCIGEKAGYNQVSPYAAVLIGQNAGRTSNGSSNYSVAIGREAGYQGIGSGCVLIGHQAGYSEQGNNKLHIANNLTESLIEGDFSAKTVNINGALTVNGAAIGGGGAMEFVSKTTVTTGTASLSFTGLVSGATYSLIFNGLDRSASAYINARFLDGNGAEITALEYGTKVTNNGSTSFTGNQLGNMTLTYSTGDITNGDIKIQLTAGGSLGSCLTKSVRMHQATAGWATEESASACYLAATVAPTGGISGIKLYPASGTFDAGILTLYKIKDS